MAICITNTLLFFVEKCENPLHCIAKDSHIKLTKFWNNWSHINSAITHVCMVSVLNKSMMYHFLYIFVRYATVCNTPSVRKRPTLRVKPNSFYDRPVKHSQRHTENCI